MVSNNTSKAGGATPSAFPLSSFFKTIFVVFFILFFSYPFELNAKKASKDYTTSIQENGTLYFIYPQNGFKNISNSNALAFDITCLDSADSLTFNFTYTDKEFFKIDSISIQTHTSPTDRIFVESSKSKWNYRYGAKFLFTDMYHFFSNTESTEIILYCENKTIHLKMKTGDWKKISQKDIRIFNVVKANKK